MAQTPVDVKKGSQARSLAPATNPWEALHSEMDRLFDRFVGFSFPSMRRMFDHEQGWRQETPFGLAAPAVDVTEDENCYKVEAELPGLDEKDIDLSINGDMLILRGEKRQEHEEKDKSHYLSERSYGSFERSFALPESVERDKINAQFTKGVLTITLPKSAKAQQKQRKIEVKAS
jgi:HSP20 family protein